MTTNELIEKYGIGYNCLSDAYALGMADGLDVLEHAIDKAREGAIDEFAKAYEKVETHGCTSCKHLDDDIKCWECISEQLKEQEE